MCTNYNVDSNTKYSKLHRTSNKVFDLEQNSNK